VIAKNRCGFLFVIFSAFYLSRKSSEERIVIRRGSICAHFSAAPPLAQTNIDPY
jgi:hypothetical protein